MYELLTWKLLIRDLIEEIKVRLTHTHTHTHTFV